MLLRAATLALCALSLSPLTASAQGREVLGHGRLVNNDLFGDGADRWQSGSVAASRVRGPSWTGALPDRPFDLLEYRIGAQVVAPENLRVPARVDRPFAGVVALGLHTHFDRGGTEFALGGDLVLTGPQTGLSDFQSALHDGLGVKPAAPGVVSGQVDNGVHPTLVMEAGRSYGVGDSSVLRPFAELRWGLETMARIGADFTIGPVGQGELMARDPVTGQRYRVIHQRTTGFSFLLGGDVATVSGSALLPESSGVTPTDTRTRLRAGMHWQGERNALFYGVTYMSEEFTAQPEGQVVGSMRLQMRF